MNDGQGVILMVVKRLSITVLVFQRGDDSIEAKRFYNKRAQFNARDFVH